MKRQIKCRGYHSFAGVTGWVYGSLLKDGETYYINEPHTSYSVEPDSIGEYTGLKDKNGKEIYEGDVMGAGKVVWQRKFARFMLLGKDWQHDMNYAVQNYEVAGSLYEYPTLIP